MSHSIIDSVGKNIDVPELHPLTKKKLPGKQSMKTQYDPHFFDPLKHSSKILDLMEKGELSGHAPPMPPIPPGLLSAQIEKMLGDRIQTFGCIDARNLLVERNSGLAHKEARKIWYINPHIPLDEITQEARLGISRAAETFNPSLGWRFSTYAIYWIISYAQRLVQKDNRGSKSKIYETLPDGRVKATIVWPTPLHFPGFAAKDGSDVDTTVGDCIPSDTNVEEDITHRDMAARIRSVIAEVFKDEKDERVHIILRDRLLASEPAKLEPLGHKLNLSREGVRLIEKKIFKMLRPHLQDVAEGFFDGRG